jgi:hypothetical protein
VGQSEATTPRSSKSNHAPIWNLVLLRMGALPTATRWIFTLGTMGGPGCGTALLSFSLSLEGSSARGSCNSAVAAFLAGAAAGAIDFSSVAGDCESDAEDPPPPASGIVDAASAPRDVGSSGIMLAAARRLDASSCSSGAGTAPDAGLVKGSDEEVASSCCSLLGSSFIWFCTNHQGAERREGLHHCHGREDDSKFGCGNDFRSTFLHIFTFQYLGMYGNGSQVKTVDSPRRSSYDHIHGAWTEGEVTSCQPPLACRSFTFSSFFRGQPARERLLVVHYTSSSSFRLPSKQTQEGSIKRRE